jgi:hypothetical protein
MEFTLIPWQAFLEALKKQKPTTRETWLRRWLFTDEGVIIATPGNSRRHPNLHRPPLLWLDRPNRLAANRSPLVGQVSVARGGIESPTRDQNRTIEK